KIGSDIPFPGTVLVANEFSKIRYQLTDCEIKKYRWLGFQCAQAVKEVCYKIKPGMSEKQIEALTSDALMRRGIRPTVILIGTDERIYNYRHATPTEKKLKKYAMINICAEKWGLVIAMTRLVHFGPLPKDLKKKMQSVARVDSTYLSMTRPGMPAFKILEAGQKAYEAEGYKDEWKAHHQGGAIGYLEREWIVYPGLKEKVRERQAFAWNPTIRGTKCEDTIICFKDRIEILTEIKDWPKIRVTIDGKTFYRPGILIRKK
ncbi:M24 family metallopeptidase, partial [SCandidatus Aminicenantes bacterium Aminicenantia_JdfR_composite]|nr:M24 family metallopeptidase [SCandidatus Aminicenantes bacterium Aminicenantia_JdfR_composite]